MWMYKDYNLLSYQIMQQFIQQNLEMKTLMEARLGEMFLLKWVSSFFSFVIERKLYSIYITQQAADKSLDLLKHKITCHL